VLSRFNEALAHVLEFEGGYVNHPKDPGGETNFGITKAVAVENGYRGAMRNIPIGVVQNIYRKKYWDAVHGDDLPYPLALVLFDFAVNSGPSRAIKTLQAALGLTRDGVIGPKTLFAATLAQPKSLAEEVLDLRLRFLKNLSTWSTFGKGWARRVAELRKTMLQS